MRLIEFGPALGRAIDAFGSKGFTLAPLTKGTDSGPAPIVIETNELRPRPG
jgi:hypothetical protein